MEKEMTVKELEQSIRTGRLKLDRLNQAAYGMTFDELLRLLCRPSEKDGGAAGPDGV